MSMFRQRSYWLVLNWSKLPKAALSENSTGPTCIDFVLYAKSASSLSVSAGQMRDTRNLSIKPVILLGTLDDKGVRPSDHNFSTVSFYVH